MRPGLTLKEKYLTTIEITKPTILFDDQSYEYLPPSLCISNPPSLPWQFTDRLYPNKGAESGRGWNIRRNWFDYDSLSHQEGASNAKWRDPFQFDNRCQLNSWEIWRRRRNERGGKMSFNDMLNLLTLRTLIAWRVVLDMGGGNRLMIWQRKKNESSFLPPPTLSTCDGHQVWIMYFRWRHRSEG